MVRLLHLSDLHFGHERAGLAAALINHAQDWAPDLTVISGDLTQRALPGQYRAAQALIQALPGLVLCVPGNHDMPVWNPVARLFWPFRAWRRAIGPELEPVVDLPGLLCVGINTADPYAWERGRLTSAALARACDRLRAARPGQLRVVALHHPLQPPPESGKVPMPGAAAAERALATAGADLLLCGHLHRWAAAPYEVHNGGRSLLCVQAGTTLSTRLRGEENDLNLIDWSEGTVTVTQMAAAGASLRFLAAGVSHFHQPDAARGWLIHSDNGPAAGVSAHA